ncbi:MAG: heavy-metal-associated domain-containing protein [Verrucomicrobia bacterium]|nr:heavy-metal-associated domain-containing protein [Verrucomicrobiota bacterium]
MKKILLPLFTIAALSLPTSAAEKKAPEPHPTTQTFYVSGVECGNCVDAITESIKKVKSVTKVEGLSAASGWVNVSFDSHKDSFHQIAQAIADAAPQHGNKYVATMKVRVPDYAKADNAAKVEGVFAKSKDLVKVEATDKAKGEFVMSFLPLTVDKSKEGPQGWNGGRFGHPIGDPAPKGLGLKFNIVREGATVAKAPAKKN